FYLSEPFRFFVRVKDRLQHRPRRRADRSVVQVDFICGNQELFAKLGPVRFFIFFVERRRRQLWCGFFEQRFELRPKSERASHSPYGRQKSTAIQHRNLPKNVWCGFYALPRCPTTLSRGFALAAPCIAHYRTCASDTRSENPCFLVWLLPLFP